MWKVVLCLCAATWSLGEAQKTRNLFQQTVDEMTKEVMEKLKETLDVDVKTMLPSSNLTYKTKYSFNMRGMGRLYNATEPFIDVIAREQAYPDGVVTVSDGHLYIAPLQKEWRKWLSHYLGPTGIICVAVLVAVILPLAGLFWCCCYWCRVGCRRRPFDREYDSWIRALLAILFIGLLTLFLLGVVCVFSSEAQVNNNLGEVPRTYRSAVGDVVQFLNSTQEQAIFLLEHSFFEIKERLMGLLKDVVPTALLVLHDASNLRSLSSLSRLVQQLDAVRADLAAVHNLTNSLRLHAVELNAGLRKVKNQLLQTLSNCNQPKCKALHDKYKIGQLDTEIQYSQMLDQYFPTLPDVSGLLQNVSRLASSGLKEEMVESTKVMRSVQRALQDAVDQQAPALRASIDGVGEKMKQLSNRIRFTVGNVTLRLNAHMSEVDAVQDAIDEYGPYRQYLGVAAALCVLLIVALLAWGLLVGVCGGRPEAYGANDCCSKAGGARSLLCGVAAVFTLGGFVALVFALNFAAGVLTQRFVCDPLTYPRDNRLLRDVDRMVDLERTLYDEKKSNSPSITSVLVQCHGNLTIYEMLQLRRALDVERLAELVAPARLAAPAPGALAGRPGGAPRADVRDKLRQLADSGLADFNFDRILDALETNMTTLALDGLARQLDSTAAGLGPRFAAEAGGLQRAARALDALGRRELAPMLRDAAALNETTRRIMESIKLPPGMDMNTAMGTLGSQAENAQAFLSENGDRLMQMVMQKFNAMIAEKLTEYIKHATHYVRYDVGRCGPLSNVFNATRDSLCIKVVRPMNGYWMALGWCILLFVPLMVTARRLAELYMQVDPYPGPLVEAEYLYDAYADRDNVPLANAYKAEKRAGREGREGREVRESRELRTRRGGGGGGGGGEGRAGGAGGAARPDSPLAPPLDAYHARRYNDMAPKHWEEGPPRYHGPTEYERPPPYYYPGPNDRQ